MDGNPEITKPSAPLTLEERGHRISVILPTAHFPLNTLGKSRISILPRVFAPYLHLACRKRLKLENSFFLKLLFLYTHGFLSSEDERNRVFVHVSAGCMGTSWFLPVASLEIRLILPVPRQSSSGEQHEFLSGSDAAGAWAGRLGTALWGSEREATH